MLILLFLLTLHTIADFFFQSDWMATNKATNPKALALHAGVYAFTFWLAGPWFVLITFALHVMVDAVTSRITKYYWETGQRHEFFVTIGVDQLLHAYCLAGTWALIAR